MLCRVGRDLQNNHPATVRCSELVHDPTTGLPYRPPCGEIMETRGQFEECGHPRLTRCGIGPDSLCQSQCAFVHPCGHHCEGTCNEHLQLGANHPPCSRRCQKLCDKCSGTCDGQCHGDKPCPPCVRPCTKTLCKHIGVCSQPCAAECDTCDQPCEYGCSHQGHCNSLCGEKCSIPGCSERCETIFECGHRCTGVCGLPCIKPCEICSGLIPNTNPDDARMKLSCGHVVGISEIASHNQLNMDSSHDTETHSNLTCPSHDCKATTEVRKTPFARFEAEPKPVELREAFLFSNKTFSIGVEMIKDMRVRLAGDLDIYLGYLSPDNELVKMHMQPETISTYIENSVLQNMESLEHWILERTQKFSIL